MLHIIQGYLTNSCVTIRDPLKFEFSRFLLMSCTIKGWDADLAILVTTHVLISRPLDSPKPDKYKNKGQNYANQSIFEHFSFAI
jgi:hypothetical protein